MAHNKSKSVVLNEIIEADDRRKPLPKLELKNKKGKKAKGKQSLINAKKKTGRYKDAEYSSDTDFDS